MAVPEGLLENLEGFVWDTGNSEKNWSRHRVTQAECEQAFGNLPLVLAMTSRGPAGESRYIALGRSDAPRALTVVFTIRGQRVRIISARPMSRRERREYARAQAASIQDKAGS